MPRDSGGDGASSSGGSVNDSGWRSGSWSGRITAPVTAPVTAPAPEPLPAQPSPNALPAVEPWPSRPSASCRRSDELAGPVAPARAIAVDQREEGGHDGARLGSIRDVLARERLLVHCVRRSPGSTDHTVTVGLLDGQHGAEVIEGRLAGAVATPSFVGLDGGVGGDVDAGGGGGTASRGGRAAWITPSGATTFTSKRHPQIVQVGSRPAMGGARRPSMPALLTSRSSPPSVGGRADQCSRGAQGR